MLSAHCDNELLTQYLVLTAQTSLRLRRSGEQTDQVSIFLKKHERMN